MIELIIDTKDIARIEAALGDKAKRLNTEIARAINDTAKVLRGNLVKQIVEKVNVKKKALKVPVAVTRKANKNKFGATVTIKKTGRLNLTDFKGTRQTKKGVSYQVETGGSRKSATSSFIVQQYGKKVYARKTNKRGPLTQLRGVSPWGVFVKNRLMLPTTRDTNAELKKQMQRRVHAITARNAARS